MTVDGSIGQVNWDSSVWIPIEVRVGVLSREGGNSDAFILDQTTDILREGRQLHGGGLNMTPCANRRRAKELLDAFVGIISENGLACVGTGLIIG